MNVNSITTFGIEKWILNMYPLYTSYTTSELYKNNNFAWIIIFPGEKEYYLGREEVAKFIFFTDGWQYINYREPELNNQKLWTKTDIKLITQKFFEI